jgi:hypothetical protein
MVSILYQMPERLFLLLELEDITGKCANLSDLNPGRHFGCTI